MPTGIYDVVENQYDTDDLFGSTPVAAPTNVEVFPDRYYQTPLVTWDGPASFPFGQTIALYEIESDGVVVDTSEMELWYSGVLDPGKHAVRVRAVNGEWSEYVSVRVDPPDRLIGPPDVQIFADGVEVDCSYVIADLTIRHGSNDFQTEPVTNTMTGALIQPTDDMVAKLRVGAAIQVEVNDSIRYFGRVRTAVLTWEDGVDYPQLNLTCIGPIEHLGWNTWSGTRPAEKDMTRGAYWLNQVFGGQPWESGPVAYDMIALTVDPAKDDSKVDKLMTDLTRSCRARCVENRNGKVVLQDAWWRDVSAEFTLDACWVGIASEWETAAEDMVNRCEVAWGVAPEGGTKPVQVYEVPVATPWSRRTVKLDTTLADSADAYDVARRIVAARMENSWKVPDMITRLDRIPINVGLQLLEGETSDKFTITGWPDPAPGDTVFGFIEGWTERLTKETWQVTWHLTSEAVTGSGGADPIDLTATAVNATRIDLAWSDHPRATQYILREGTTVLYTGLNRTFTHTVNQGTTHTYTVEAYNSRGLLASDTAKATTPNVGSADKVSITYSQAHNGQCRLSWTKPADVDWGGVRLYARVDRYPTSAADAQAASGVYTGNGSGVNIFGPGVGDRSDQYVYVRFISRNTLGEENWAQPADTRVFFLRSPVEFRPTVRNAYGVTYGWENQSRTRAGNTSSNTYRYIWCYGTQINDVMGGRKCVSIHVLMYRADGGPGGGLVPRVGLHKYTGLPGGQPTIDGVQGWGGAIARNSGAWVQIDTGWGDQLSAASGGYRAPGGGYDATDVNQTWVGQAHADDGTIHFRHSDYS